MTVLGVVWAGLQLALILAQFWIKRVNMKDADVEGAFKEGKDAIKNRDSSAFHLAIDRLNRLRHR
jgi:hypothetical protein